MKKVVAGFCICLVVVLFPAVVLPTSFLPLSAGRAVSIPLSDCPDGGDCCSLFDCICPNSEGRCEPSGACDNCKEFCDGNSYCIDNCCSAEECPYSNYDESVLPSGGQSDPGSHSRNIRSLIFGSDFHLSVINVLLTVLTLLLAIFSFANYFRRDCAGTASIAMSYLPTKERSDWQKRRLLEHLKSLLSVKSLLLTIAMTLASAVSISLLFATQYFSAIVVLFDQWSIVHALFYAAVSLCTHALTLPVSESNLTVTSPDPF